MREKAKSLRILSAGHKQNGIQKRGRKIRLKIWTILEKTKKALSEARKWSAEVKQKQEEGN